MWLGYGSGIVLARPSQARYIGIVFAMVNNALRCNQEPEQKTLLRVTFPTVSDRQK